MSDEEMWKQRVGEWKASGLSGEQFSQERGFSKARLWAWSSKLKRAEKGGSGSEGTGVRLVRVLRRKPAEPAGAAVTVELHGVRVLVPAGVDTSTLGAVLEAVDRLQRVRGASR